MIDLREPLDLEDFFCFEGVKISEIENISGRTRVGELIHVF